MQGDGAQQSPGHGACHHTHAETSAHEPEVASPIFPIGDVGDIGASNRTSDAGGSGHDASGVEDLGSHSMRISMLRPCAHKLGEFAM
ncbi:hypothetical protein ACS53_00060 [Bacillus cereus]|nr:hypothetical protein ACS53_00060 [Bacillus cereus]